MLGIRAFQVPTTNDESIQFDPCFFLPHPERLLQKYPRDNSSNVISSHPRTLRDPTPTLEDNLKDEDGDLPSDPEDRLRVAKSRLEFTLDWRDDWKDEWYTHANIVHNYINAHIGATREGPTGRLHLSDLVNQRYWW
ncbi:unnamed protein product [Penicillium nalgiovense]|nr:unnamed protein product [Penicillium nalgiovense]